MGDLAYFLLFANTASVVGICIFEFTKKEGYISLPFLTSIIFLTWFIPQIWTVFIYSIVPDASFVRLLTMSLLCFWGMMLGWYLALGKSRRRYRKIKFPADRLFLPVLGITLFAMAMNFLIEMQPVEVRASGQWTGTITILAFFASVNVVSMALAAVLFLQNKNPKTILLLLLNLSIYMPLVFVFFRRGEAFELILIVLLAFMFVRNVKISRSLILVGAFAGFFVINGVGQLRSLGGGYQLNDYGELETRIPSFEEISEINWFQAVDQSQTIDRSEVVHAAVSMDAIARTGNYTFGAQLWNKLVFSYVPGQLIGYELKDQMMIGQGALELAESEFSFEKKVGSTSTGFVQPFHDFWYLGFLVWALTGFVMGRFMSGARAGNVIAYTLYATTIANAMHVTTHFGYYLFSQSILIVIAVIFLNFWAHRPSRNVPHKRYIGSAV